MTVEDFNISLPLKCKPPSLQKHKNTQVKQYQKPTEPNMQNFTFKHWKITLLI